MLQFDEYKVRLNNLAPVLEELGQALDLESAERELDMLQAESASDGFWNNLEKAQKVQQRIKTLQHKVDSQHKRKQHWDDLMALCEMGNEFEDESLLPELEEGFAQLEAEMEEARLQTLLTGEYDSSNVILTIHPGAGGTEAQDWAQMLYRMYTRWAEAHGFTYKILDYLDGDEAGLKSADIMIEGDNAYGFLKGEAGVHRLVRVSPFDAAGRRHTSFSAVEVRSTSVKPGASSSPSWADPPKRPKIRWSSPVTTVKAQAISRTAAAAATAMVFFIHFIGRLFLFACRRRARIASFCS